MATLNVDRSAIRGEPEDETTWPILIVRIILDHFTHHNRIAKLLHAYVAEDALIHSIL